MKYTNLINLLDEFNMHNIAAALYYKPDNIIFIYEDNEEEREIFEELKEYLKGRLPKCDIKGIGINDINKNAFEDIIKNCEKDNTIVNTSGGNRLLGLLAYKICKDSGYEAIYIDIDDEIIYNLMSEESISIDSIEFNVEDFIISAGGKVIDESSNLFDSKAVQKFVNYIVNNFAQWKTVKPLLRNYSVVQHDKIIPSSVEFNLTNINIKTRKIFKEFLNQMARCGLSGILHSTNKKVIMKFINADTKTFIFKAGTWLEVLAYSTLKELQEVDDIKAGVVFLWDDEVRAVKNEVDVLAANDSQLIYISCKDTPKYEAEDLNELHVYAEKIGGEDAKKILVTTHQSFKSSIPVRAEEMGIEIIIFDGNIEKFKERIRRVIE